MLHVHCICTHSLLQHIIWKSLLYSVLQGHLKTLYMYTQNNNCLHTDLIKSGGYSSVYIGSLLQSTVAKILQNPVDCRLFTQLKGCTFTTLLSQHFNSFDAEEVNKLLSNMQQHAWIESTGLSSLYTYKFHFATLNQAAELPSQSLQSDKM